jgi:hypothetical protein
METVFEIDQPIRQFYDTTGSFFNWKLRRWAPSTNQNLIEIYIVNVKCIEYDLHKFLSEDRILDVFNILNEFDEKKSNGKECLDKLSELVKSKYPDMQLSLRDMEEWKKDWEKGSVDWREVAQNGIKTLYFAKKKDGEVTIEKVFGEENVIVWPKEEQPGATEN